HRAGGRRCPDATGVGTTTTSLRTERARHSDGHVHLAADHGHRGSCNGVVTVCVPALDGRVTPAWTKGRSSTRRDRDVPAAEVFSRCTASAVTDRKDRTAPAMARDDRFAVCLPSMIEADPGTVLVVEDDAIMRHALESMLDVEGYATMGVGSANEALTYLATS